ncbi:HD-GYP domain-containing protein [Deinococcus deserti]|uniref:Putative metal dependent phosphohydrolase n=1 Tax=Deinococcus deserti (strain DSM 17065 / CIP 109153 / LMG 22923 / VCD115) TaxID=546414 RepID=C1D1G7_DEIDV|nr:HD-GYP domain-containing protein [Deinococcus deserti]ACO45691.2 putative metal dependent phosphohydrolase [Deinococcus deserti VCD115]
MWQISPLPTSLALMGAGLLVVGALTRSAPLMAGAALVMAMAAPLEAPVKRLAVLSAYPVAFFLSLTWHGVALGVADLLGALLVSGGVGVLVLGRQQAAKEDRWQQRVVTALHKGSQRLPAARDSMGIIRAGLDTLDVLKIAPHLAFVAYREGTPMILAGRGAYGAVVDTPVHSFRDGSAGHSVQTDLLVAEHAAALLRPQAARHTHMAPVHGHAGIHLGLLLLSRSEDLPFTPEEKNAVQAFARLLGGQLGQWQAISDLYEANDQTLRALGSALELRDDNTGGHTNRVVSLAVRLARHLGWNERQIHALRCGAYLHDLGKIAIPDDILHKAGTLSEEERRVIQTHATRGHDMLQNLQFLPAETLDLVRYHHERWDGKGYPAGLRGHQIPEGARLFSIIDVYDALTHARPYKAAWSCERAAQELREQAGRQFDPFFVDAFLELMVEQDEAQLVS